MTQTGLHTTRLLDSNGHSADATPNIFNSEPIPSSELPEDGMCTRLLQDLGTKVRQDPKTPTRTSHDVSLKLVVRRPGP